tara:strand:+ start:359 stop:1147 length:789 start_codon:yes stop_codon:yes gene_type:complete
MDMDKEKDYIKTIQRCQRNWDLSKEIPQEHINHWLWIAQNAPSKQHEAYYDVYFIRKPEVIKEMLDYTWGFTATPHPGDPTLPPSCWKNPQMGANFYMCFVSKFPDTMRNFNADGTGRSPEHANRRDNCLASIGMAMGLVARSAAEMGYVTGFNKNMSAPPDKEYWFKRLNIAEDISNGTKQLEYGIGIGYPQQGRNHNESDEHEVMIGQSTGGWTDQDYNVVDISSGTAKDPQGNVHHLPKEITFPTFSKGNRIINCFEVK